MSHGLCSPEQIAACPLTEHFTDQHHSYYPRRKYRGLLAATFRGLPENKEQLCRFEHNELHANEPIPVKPSTAEMREAIAQSALKGAYEQSHMDRGMAVLPTDHTGETLANCMA